METLIEDEPRWEEALPAEAAPTEPSDTPPAKPKPAVARPLSVLVSHSQNDPNELLRDRYLCRGGGALLLGPTGMGKSSLAMQYAILWGLKRECFGITPVRPLKSLVIQAENDEGDLAEMRDGVIKGLALSPEDAKRAGVNILIVTEDTRFGMQLCADVIAPLLAEHHPDLLWLDPALAYLGGESNSQKDVGGFLRNGINPLLHKFGCAGIVIHHTNKPKTGKEKPGWEAGDFAYLGAGSAEWANWSRAVLALRSIGSHEVFELHAGKRGGRLRWRDPQGAPLYVRYLAHATEPGVICWYEVDPEDTSQGGRPKDCDPGDLLKVLPPEGLESEAWANLARAEYGVSRATFYREKKAFEKSGRILKSKVTGLWQPVSKK